MRTANDFKLLLISSIGLALLVSGCGGGSSSSQADTASPSSSGFQGNPYTHLYDANQLVCNPLGGNSDGQASGYNYGLSAVLYYLTANQTHYTDVEDYFANGTLLQSYLFFNNVDVPTRDFYEGFPSESGKLLATNDGTTLLEWFAIRYESVIQLSPSDEPGYYQFATLSDDGTILSLDLTGSGTLTPFLNNDSDHPTRLGCAKSAVQMNAGSLIPMRLDYFQGPRYQIANVLLWRRLPDGANLNDPNTFSDPGCGKTGNYTWFDPDVSTSPPTQTYLDLISRGWKVLNPENFLLPDSIAGNPCINPGA